MNTNFIIVDTKKEQWKKELNLLKAHLHLKENERKSKMMTAGYIMIMGCLGLFVLAMESRNEKLSQQ